MSDEQLNGQTPDGVSKAGKEFCECGHTAGRHVVGKYTCQAPGSRKGYCPCMRFIPKGAGREKKAAAAGEEAGAEK
jgi:hypothetical protein